MIRFILTKIKNKYKLYICLVIGIIAIVAVSSLIMMFRNGSLDKLLQSSFITSYEKKNNQYPAVLRRESFIDYDPSKANMTDYASETIDSFQKSWEHYLDIPVISQQRLIKIKGRNFFLGLKEKTAYLDIVYMDPYMEGHYDFSEGGEFDSDISAYTAEGLEIPKGAYPCIVSRQTADLHDLVVGEIISVDKYAPRDSESTPGGKYPVLNFYITGIITEKPGDYYWQSSLVNNGTCAYVSKETINDILRECDIDGLSYEMNSTFDYRYIKSGDVSYLSDALKFFHSKDKDLSENISSVLAAYEHESLSLKAILYVISLPLIILVLLFIGMISFRIVDSERDEISQLTRRGISRLRIIFMYLIQSFLLSAVSLVPGVAIGFVTAKITASVDDFLGFHIGGSGISTNSYRFSFVVFLAGFISLFIVIFITVLPVIISTGRSDVVHKRKRKNNGNLPFWERYFVDVIFLVLSLYLLYNYSKQIDSIANDVLKGNGIDPVIFLDSTLFLISCGLIILRLSNYLLMLIYKMTKNKLMPAGYAGVLQVLRSRQKTSTLSIFLVITVAMSLFNANMARTINSNQEERITLNTGTDYVLKEHWFLTVIGKAPDQRWKYTEPDADTYYKLVEKGKAESVTKVLRDNNAKISLGDKKNANVSLFGIQTKEFGLTATMPDGINEKHWYNYLNALSQKTNGVIISSSLAKATKKKVGDTITYSRISPINSAEEMGKASGEIVAIVDAWPGYQRYMYSYDDEGVLQMQENHLVVANYANVLNTFNATPYEIWIKSSLNQKDMQATIDECFEGTDRYLYKFDCLENSITQMKSSALIQITNGIFTAMFIIALLLCIMGFMIHWISSIRDRTLMFGIYRAMGISMGEVERMLVIEQVFLSVISIIAGVVSGIVATKMFSKIFAVVYLPQKHSLPLQTVTAANDMIRLGIILLATVLICMLVLRRIINKMNITQALKLGED